ncbi:MAG: hypothetical protein GY865_08380 [candidate division Zixibacteria bacterium]|nr:hypothetical protein [candidate division Zixibacteria bacterium]
MLSKIIFLLCLLILVLLSISNAQGLIDGPEHITYDIANDRYIVCNYDGGTIIAIDPEGVETLIDEGLYRPYANHIVGDTLYVTQGQNRLKAYDLNTFDLLWDEVIYGSVQLDGLTYGNDGNLYIVDAINIGRIFKFTISDHSYEIFVDTDIEQYPQDIIYDELNDRLLVVAYYTNAPIQAVSLSDGTVTDLVVTSFGSMDGIAMDNNRNVYVGCFPAGIIYMYDQTFTNPPKIVSTLHALPTGLGYNPVDNILAIPNYGGSTIDYFPLDDNDGDDIYDFRDNCPEIPNTSQDDFDEDGDGDACDACPENFNPDHEDSDGDGFEDACDNCPDHINPGQEDVNGNDVGDPCDYVCGDIDDSPGINILDIVFVINNVYKSGADPDPLESADVNHDYFINILDIVHLINFIYKSGNAPECIVW